MANHVLQPWQLLTPAMSNLEITLHPQERKTT
jgi:hypothetical protein